MEFSLIATAILYRIYKNVGHKPPKEDEQGLTWLNTITNPNIDIMRSDQALQIDFHFQVLLIEHLDSHNGSMKTNMTPCGLVSDVEPDPEAANHCHRANTGLFGGCAVVLWMVIAIGAYMKTQGRLRRRRDEL